MYMCRRVLLTSLRTELAVGNIVRRVLHIIREEAQTESMERKLEKNETSQIDKRKIQGLLTRALKQTFSQRNFSLTNLLDRDLFDASTLGTPTAVVSNHIAMVDTLPSAGEGLEDVSEAGDAESAMDGASTARGKGTRKGRGQWDRKPSVIEQINELIEGLDNVAEVAFDAAARCTTLHLYNRTLLRKPWITCMPTRSS